MKRPLRIREKKPLCILNKEFGQLRVGSYYGKDNRRNHAWNCYCSCGGHRVVSTSRLTHGVTKTCGCAKEHHGLWGTNIYTTWQSMLQRCSNKNNDQYQNYGGRGIMVCKRWKSLKNFHNDMGDPPLGMTLDRINNDGNYCPENCRWATNEEQANNKRSNVMVTINGQTKSLMDWSKTLGIKYTSVASRRRRGSDPLESLMVDVPENKISEFLNA